MFGVARNTDKWPNAIIFLSNTRGIYLILQANPKQPSILQYSRISLAKRTAGPIVHLCVYVCLCVNKQCTSSCTCIGRRTDVIIDYVSARPLRRILSDRAAEKYRARL